MSISILRLAGLLAVLGFATAGCSAPAVPFGASSARASDDSFTLTFNLGKTVWSASESIQGTATLVYSGRNSLEITHDGSGPFTFSYIELTGNRVMGYPVVSDLVCASQVLESGKVLKTALFKVGAYDPAEPNYEFYKAFFADPKTIHLPAGLWLVTAYVFLHEKECGGTAWHALQAGIVILVRD